MLGVGLELKDRGHRVYVMTHNKYRPYVESAECIYMGTDWENNDFKSQETVIHEIIYGAHSVHAALIICEATVFAPAYAAEKLGIPWVSFLSMDPLDRLNHDGRPQALTTLKKRYGRILQTIREKIKLPRLDDDSRMKANLYGISPYLHLIAQIPQFVMSRNTFNDVTYCIGHCSFEKTSRIPEIDSGSTPALLVCLSSVRRSLVDGITARYVTSSIEAFGGRPYQVFVSDTAFLNWDIPENFRIYSEYPIHHILMPRVDLVITHGGAGTLQKAIKFGKPMIIIPVAHDHKRHSQLCKELGIAEIIEPRDLTASNLAETVDKMLNTPNYKAQITTLSEQVGQMDSNRKGADLIDALLRK